MATSTVSASMDRASLLLPVGVVVGTVAVAIPVNALLTYGMSSLGETIWNWF